ncbi:TetR/AcrR family transcriptional regulator [Gemmatimonas sp.]|jgi:AcrR family transcriptional regulator|uniref:TetR/AcrR family transcriptional regulator n=1 Tax=Gemmatimonas sp. TaxID=1962908 RepID=UPI0037C145F4
MIDDHRHRILQAAARVYTQHGWRGATTRRIAEEAGVNEVTLFRHFGSKDALLAQMMRELEAATAGMQLPPIPVTPEAELLGWMVAHHSETCARRPFIRQLMSDLETHPDLVGCATEGPNSASNQLREYVGRLAQYGFIQANGAVPEAEVEAAVTMLMGALFADGMNRDVMPMMFTQTVDVSLQSYVRIFLRGIRAVSGPSGPTARTAAVVSSPTSISE